MELDTVLMVSPRVSVLPIGDELSLFDDSTGQALALNRTAADILALVDGSATLADIATIVARAYDRPQDEAADAVAAVAATLLEHGAVTAAG